MDIGHHIPDSPIPETVGLEKGSAWITYLTVLMMLGLAIDTGLKRDYEDKNILSRQLLMGFWSLVQVLLRFQHLRQLSCCHFTSLKAGNTDPGACPCCVTVSWVPSSSCLSPPHATAEPVVAVHCFLLFFCCEVCRSLAKGLMQSWLWCSPAEQPRDCMSGSNCGVRAAADTHRRCHQEDNHPMCALTALL